MRFRYGIYIGNTYGAGSGTQCLDGVECDGDETSFFLCGSNILPHDDPTQDVSIRCYPGNIFTVLPYYDNVFDNTNNNIINNKTKHPKCNMENY